MLILLTLSDVVLPKREICKLLYLALLTKSNPSHSVAGTPIVAALPWRLIWQGLGGWPQPRCSVAPGNLSKIGKPNSYRRVPHCMEFDSGGNYVRIRTGKTLWLGKAPLIGVRRDSNVSSDKKKPHLKALNSEKWYF